MRCTPSLVPPRRAKSDRALRLHQTCLQMAMHELTGLLSGCHAGSRRKKLQGATRLAAQWISRKLMPSSHGALAPHAPFQCRGFLHERLTMTGRSSGRLSKTGSMVSNTCKT